MKAKKPIAALLSVALSLTTFVACGRTQIKDENSGKSILKVYNYAGGFGKEWMAEMEKRFEEAFADTEFEAGKKGVDVRVTNNKEYFGRNFLR